MKKLIVFFVLFLTLSAYGQKRETVIVNPEFDSSNAAEWLQFSRIELSDSATIVQADVYNRPNNWIRFLSGSTLRGSSGKIYKLIGCKGLELDKEVFMPESGSVSFAALFEPVDKSEKTISYYESESENDWRIYGIKLYAVKHTEPIQCTLKGEVKDRPQSSRFILLKAGEDFRTANITYLPIHDGKFEYLLHTDAEQAYNLVFYDETLAGAWRSIEFIAEQGTINFVLQPMDKWEDNLIEGKLTTEYQAVKREIRNLVSPLYDSLNTKRELLEKTGKYLTVEAGQLDAQIGDLEQNDPKRRQLIEQFIKLRDEGKFLTPEAQALQDEDMKLYKFYNEKQIQYSKEHVGIVGYAILVECIRIATEQTKDDVSPMFEIYRNSYKAKYPHHPYAALVESYINASSIKVGNSYFEVSAIGPDGKTVKLSELAKGKVMLIHLWASWCGPCRKHGMEMIPIYEKYKDKGFTVVGIARERNKNAMFTAIDHDKYPWINLLELNDHQGIWSKFGVGNAGGGDFLVDEKGVFLSVNATPDEVKKILEAKYN
jgi:thiol-disulfide isomerase/thioredoxin